MFNKSNKALAPCTYKIYNLKFTIMKIITNIRILLILTLIVLLSSNQSIAQNVGIGSESFTPDLSAGLEVKFTDKGFLPPRMTSEERDLIASPANGLQIFNLTIGCPEYFFNGFWYNQCGSCVPNAPTAGTHVPDETQIVWNWNTVPGAIGYKWHTSNNYEASTDLGNTTTITQTGLTCNTSNVIYVWAYKDCGNSTVLTLAQTTTSCSICNVSSLTFTYNGSQVTYGTVESNGKCWLDRNLGATAVATSSTHTASYGDLFQWGRRDDGHQSRTSNTTTALSNSDIVGHGNFIRNINNPWDWRSPQNANLWQGESGINNPCPTGWRVPTEAEWNTERQNWGSNNADGAINSPLKLPLAGARSLSDGTLDDVGVGGRYWSSSADGTWSIVLIFSTGNSSLNIDGRAYGFSIRCIKN